MLRIAAARALRHGAIVRPVVASRAFSVTDTRRQASVSDAMASTPSFMRGLYSGQLHPDQVFPFPDVMSPDNKENLQAMLDPVQQFLAERNDPAKNDETATVPDEVTQGLRELGLFGLQVPTELDGLGLSNTAYARLVEVIGGEDLGLGIFLGAHQSIGFKGILLVGTEEQRQKYLPKLATGEHIAAFCLTEPSSGSDANSIRTRAKLSADGKHFILNGGKLWISNGGIADIFTVFAQTEVVDEKTGQKRDKVTAFIVERKFGGITSGPPEKKMGIRCSNTTTLTFDDCKVPVENVLGTVGGGFKVAMAILNNGRFGMGAVLAGTMKKMMALAAEHAINRKQFGSTIKEYELIQEKFARMAVKCYVAESMAYLVSSNMDRGAPDFQIEAAISKVFASEAAWWVTDECIQVMGGLGFMKDLPFERFLRDLRIFRIFEGTNDILRVFIALEGMRNAGEGLKGLQKAVKAPLQNVDVLLDFGVRRARGALGIRPGSSGELNMYVHESLRPAARQIEAAAADFGECIEHVLMTYQKDVVGAQLVLKRVAESAMAIYGMAAVASRATRSLEQNLPSAQHELLLAQTYCQEASEEVKKNLVEARNPRATTDNKLKQIAAGVFDAHGYIPPHPLGF